MRLPCQGALNSKFKGYVANYIKDYQHISELRDIHTDQDNRFFYVKALLQTFSRSLPSLMPSNRHARSVTKLTLTVLMVMSSNYRTQ